MCMRSRLLFGNGSRSPVRRIENEKVSSCTILGYVSGAEIDGADDDGPSKLWGMKLADLT